jgi:hypothetical protein
MFLGFFNKAGPVAFNLKKITKQSSDYIFKFDYNPWTNEKITTSRC